MIFNALRPCGYSIFRIPASIFMFFVILVLAHREGLAENSRDYFVSNLAAGLGQVAFDGAGAIRVAGQTLNAVTSGRVSPIMQFVLANSVMNSCVKNAIRYKPNRKDPYVIAQQRFEYGICLLQKCFQTQMLLMLLPQLSSVSSYGGSDSPDARRASASQGLILAQAFQQNGSCNGSSGGALDPSLLAIFATASR